MTDYDEIRDAWNAMAEKNGLATVRILSAKRRASIRARIKDAGGVYGVLEAIDKVPESSFLLGKNKRGWKAHFDFLLQPSSFAKVLEGFYSSEQSGTLSVFDVLRELGE